MRLVKIFCTRSILVRCILQFVFMLLASASCQTLCAQTLRVGFFDTPPHAFIKAGVPAGAAVDLFKAVSEKMGVKEVVFQQMPLTRLVVMLERGEIDAALFMAQGPERAAKFYFPPKPYYMSQPGVVVSASSALTHIKTMVQIKWLKIGVLQGGYLSPSMHQAGLILEPLSGSDGNARNLQKVVRGRLDAAYTPDMYVFTLDARELGFEKLVRVLPLPDPSNGVYTAFSKKVGATYGPRYAEALEAVLKEKGEYAKAFLK